MKLQELLEHLHDIHEVLEINGEDIDPEIFIASQPSYPMQYKIDNVEIVQPNDESKPKAVYISESFGNEYLPSGVAEAIGW